MQKSIVLKNLFYSINSRQNQARIVFNPWQPGQREITILMLTDLSGVYIA